MTTEKPVTGIFQPAPPAVLSGSVTNKAGAADHRAWAITLANNGPGVAYTAQLFVLTFTQTFGAPCTSPPVRLSPASLPVAVGTLSAGGSAQTQVAVDFSGCPVTARFTVNAGYMSNGGASGGMIHAGHRRTLRAAGRDRWLGFHDQGLA